MRWSGLVIVLAACGGGTPPATPTGPTVNAAPVDAPPEGPCDTFVRKIYPVFVADMKAVAPDGRIPPAADLVAECEAHPDELDDPLVICVIGAADEPAVRECLDTSHPGEGQPRQPEPMVLLNRIGQNMKATYITDLAIPKGSTGLTPPAACCGQPSNVCAVNTLAWTSNPIWSALDIQIDDPARFQYRYESTDGQTATVRAIGDLDCDGRSVEYLMQFGARDGNPWVTIVEPPEGSD